LLSTSTWYIFIIPLLTLPQFGTLLTSSSMGLVSCREPFLTCSNRSAHNRHTGRQAAAGQSVGKDKAASSQPRTCLTAMNP
jgi:hypothetical protein